MRTAMTSTDAGKEDQRMAINQEAGIVQAQQPDEKEDEVVEVAQEEVKPGLPFSKARGIALVITVTAASFLNVRICGSVM